MSVQRHKCFLCLDTVSTGKLNRPYYKVHLENIHNVRCNVDRLLNWVIEQRPIPNGPSSSRASSTLSSVANLMGMKGITITKDTSASNSIPDTLINIKGITVQKVSDDIQIIENDVEPQHQRMQQQHQLSPGASARLQNAMAGGLTAYSAPSPRGSRGGSVRGGQMMTGMRGGMMVSPRGRGMSMSMRGASSVGRGGMMRPGMAGMARGQNTAISHNTLLKQQEAAIEKWANSCEHGCRICKREGKSFTTLIRQNLVKHLETIHTITEKDYKAEFKVHSLITRASNVVCTLCSQKVKRLPASLSGHMKKHKMTIRQYWMKYVAPQGSPLATFQPRPMGGPVLRGGGHPAMRGMSPMRGSSRGRAPLHSVMRRGAANHVMNMKDNIVIGEVFSMNGGGSNIEHGEVDSGEIEIDEKNILLNTSSDAMEVELDPLAMLASCEEPDQEDSKDFFNLDGVPVKADPDDMKNQEAVEVDMQAIKAMDVKPVIKIEKQDSDEAGQQSENPESTQPENESSSQPNASEATSGDENPAVNDTTANADKSNNSQEQADNNQPQEAEEADNEDSNVFQIVSCETAGSDGEAGGGEQQAGDGGGGEGGDENTTHSTMDDQVNTPVMESDLINEETNEDPFSDTNKDGGRLDEGQEDSSNNEAGNVESENTSDYPTPGGDDVSSDAYAQNENSMNHPDMGAFYDDNATNHLTGERDHVQTMDDMMPEVSATSAGETEEDSSAGLPNLEAVSSSGDWYTMSCPYHNPQCPLFCCHVRALQELQEGSTDWNTPYGPPANGEDPCTCCVND